MRNHVILWCTFILLWTISCIDGDDRCGSAKWDPMYGACIIAVQEDTETSPQNPDGGEIADGGEDSEDVKEPVMEAPCETDADCLAYNTNYCLVVDPNPGFCTIKNCADTPDICPSGYTCCTSLMPDFYLDHCMSNDIYNEVGETLCAL